MGDMANEIKLLSGNSHPSLAKAVADRYVLYLLSYILCFVPGGPCIYFLFYLFSLFFGSSCILHLGILYAMPPTIPPTMSPTNPRKGSASRSRGSMRALSRRRFLDLLPVLGGGDDGGVEGGSAPLHEEGSVDVDDDLLLEDGETTLK